jgi:hypothetical protein
MYLVWGRVKF